MSYFFATAKKLKTEGLEVRPPPRGWKASHESDRVPVPRCLSPRPDGDRSAGLFRFGVFEADLHSCELRKNGRKVPLQGQPFQVFALLLQQSGKLVNREELRQKVWPADIFVDFDHGLNTAITKIRIALGDSADNPRFVETLPRRGYRFIAPVEDPSAKVGEPGRVGALSLASERTVRFTSTKRLALLFSLLGLLVLAAVALWLNLRSPLSIPAVVDSVQITKDELQKFEGQGSTLHLLSDGSRLYFTESLPAGAALMQVSTQGGETARIPVTLENPKVYDISPIRSELLVAAGVFNAWTPSGPFGSCHSLRDRRIVSVTSSPMTLAGPPTDIIWSLSMTRTYSSPNRMVVKSANSPPLPVWPLGSAFRRMERGYASQSAAAELTSLTPTLWRSRRMEPGCTGCPFMDSAELGQRTGSTTFT